MIINTNKAIKHFIPVHIIILMHGILWNFSNFFSIYFGIFILHADLAASFVRAIMCCDVATYVHAMWQTCVHVCVHVRVCVHVWGRV